MRATQRTLSPFEQVQIQIVVLFCCSPVRPPSARVNGSHSPSLSKLLSLQSPVRGFEHMSRLVSPSNLAHLSHVPLPPHKSCRIVPKCWETRNGWAFGEAGTLIASPFILLQPRILLTLVNSCRPLCWLVIQLEHSRRRIHSYSQPPSPLLPRLHFFHNASRRRRRHLQTMLRAGVRTLADLGHAFLKISILGF